MGGRSSSLRPGGTRRLMPPIRKRRGAVVEDWIRQNIHALHLNEERGMAYPGDLNPIRIGIFDSSEIRLDHVGLIRWKLIGRNEGRLTRAQAQFPS